MKAGSKRFFEALANWGIALTIVMMVAAGAAAGDFHAQPAYAQGLEAQSLSGSGAALVVAAAGDSASAAAGMRTPSGIAAIDAKSSGALTATRAYRSSSTAGSTSGWRSAIASWYGPGFYGNTMASGEILTRTSMVVAHRTLPFGTRIQFSFKGRTCVAVVMDRGPFGAGRTFDLGPGTAQALGFSGVATVQYRIL